jgi:hypothetical protein
MRLLVFLENHACAKSRQFIADNIENLKRLGYKKFLLELPKNLSLASVKKQFQGALESTKPSSLNYKNAQSYLYLFDALEKHHMAFEFIDSRQELRQEDIQKLFALGMQKGFDSVHAEMRKDADSNDEIIVKEIIQQASKCTGGVIYLAGFEHTRLVQQLKNENCCFTILDNSGEICSMGTAAKTAQDWKKISNDSFRYDLYNTNVYYFDLASNPSFDLVQSACQLLPVKPCEEPTVGKYLRLTSKQNFFYTIDSNHVVSAISEIPQNQTEAVVFTIKSKFPMLRFFIDKQPGRLVIPGINLTENKDTLSQGFIASDVMNKAY